MHYIGTITPFSPLDPSQTLPDKYQTCSITFPFPILPSSTNRFQNRLTNALCTRRVLSGDELPLILNNHKLSPGLIRLLIIGANGLNPIFQQEGHELGHIDSVLLSVTEPGDLPTSKEGLAVGPLGIHKDDGAVTHGGDDLSLGSELLDDSDAIGVVDEVEHGPVAAGVEQRGELVGAALEGRQGLRLLPDSLLVSHESLRARVFLERRHRCRI